MHKDINRTIWTFTMLILAVGLVALYSAAHQNVRVPHKVFYDQVAFALLGLATMFVLSRIDYRRFYDGAYVFYGITVVILIMVMLSGRHALGARRWLEIGGISFQPSELAKLGLILALARYFSHRKPAMAFSFRSTWYLLTRDLLIPLAITGAPMLLIFKQPDLGSSILIFGIFMVMLFASGIRYRYIIGFVSVCLMVVPFGWHILKPYQKDRLLVFLNPNIDPLGAGYTIIQSKIAIGSGQLAGKGWLSGTQSQLNFLPERHTDFIFSVIGEEWGLVGTLFLLSCYFIVIRCGLRIAEQLKDRFGMQLAVGIIGIMSIQVVINMGMVMGLLPVVGITLPLISYGRTSLMISMVMLGFLLSLNRKRTVF